MMLETILLLMGIASCALVLIAFVMILNLLARGIARWKAPKTGR